MNVYFSERRKGRHLADTVSHSNVTHSHHRGGWSVSTQETQIRNISIMTLAATVQFV
jgi:hypothetical protein